MYLHCPRCRLTVYRRVEESAVSTCARCGGEAYWLSPPQARVPAAPAPAGHAGPSSGRFRLRSPNPPVRS